MSASLGTLDSRFRPWAQWLVDWARWAGLNPQVTSTYRSLKEQARLYREYQAGRHPLPVAPPGRSLHNYGLAVDLVADDLPRLGRLWMQVGGSWSASDPVHFGVR